MKVIKRINNNTVLCLDSRNREVVAFGKGIAFAVPKGSDELPLAAIERTFYNVDEHYVALLEELRPEVLALAADIIETAAPSLSYELSPNATLALADHVSFALQRHRQGIVVHMPLSYDVAHMYPIEYQAGVRALRAIERDLQASLPHEEATGIALCLVNAALAPAAGTAEAARSEDDTLIDAVTQMIERRYGTAVDRDGFEFARFATHMHYLLDRIHSGEEPFAGDAALYESARASDGQAAACADEICELLMKRFPCTISDNEKLYIILHVNRVAHRRGEGGHAG